MHRSQRRRAGRAADPGAFTLPKTSAQAWTLGAVIYWDGTPCTTSDGSGANTRIGHAVAAADNPSATGVVRLSI
jgi:predicted RecA/RadA family phage recombinase